MNLQLLSKISPNILTDAYAMFDALELSVTSLVVAGLLLTLVFLFALREAATWFFKINDIKSDVRKLRQLVIDMEGEVRMLNGLLAQNVKLANAGTRSGETRMATSELQTPQSIKIPAIKIPAIEIPAIEIPAIEIPAIEIPAIKFPVTH